MKKWIFILTAVLAQSFEINSVQAAAPTIPLMKVNNDLSDKASLQNGAKLFMNYCFGCHSTQYQRYQRVARDLGIPDDLMLENLVFDKKAKIGDLMKNAMLLESGASWFGAPPPDLTLVARVRGTNWLYTYLHSFYKDDSRPFGVNNLLFPSVGMPHVLEGLQGTPLPVMATRIIDGVEENFIERIEVVLNGEMSKNEYDMAVTDIINFLEYSGDPVKLERHALGYWVLAFIILFTFVAYLLKKEYWREVK